MPAVLIAVFAALVSVVAASQHPARTPDGAVQALAEGDRLMTLARYDDAVDSYTEAIRLSADYAEAYRARGTAQALAGSPETASYVFTTVDQEARERSIADLEKALELITPEDGKYYHHVREVDFNGYAHIRAALLPISLTIPILEGRLVLGTHQEIQVVDNQPEELPRFVVLQIIGE